jgi:hypothetical protein
MVLKIVNSLSSKMEIGAPMAALYLLGNPDRYASHDFVSFYWRNYVTSVRNGGLYTKRQTHVESM